MDIGRSGSAESGEQQTQISKIIKYSCYLVVLKYLCYLVVLKSSKIISLGKYRSERQLPTLVQLIPPLFLLILCIYVEMIKFRRISRKDKYLNAWNYFIGARATHIHYCPKVSAHLFICQFLWFIGGKVCLWTYLKHIFINLMLNICSIKNKRLKYITIFWKILFSSE